MTTEARLMDNMRDYADLVLSVGVQGDRIKRSRPLSPAETAQYIARLIRENKEPMHATARRLGLGRTSIGDPNRKEDTTQLRRYLDLLKLSPRSRMVLGYGRSDPGKIPFSTGAEIARLDSHGEQDKVIQSALERGIAMDEARRIVRYRKEHANSTIEECIEKVLKLRPVSVVCHVVCCTMHERFRGGGKGKPDMGAFARLLRSRLGGAIHKVKVRGRVVMIFMDEEAFAGLDREMNNKGMSLSRYVNHVIGEAV